VVLESTPIAPAAVITFLDVVRAHGLAPFVCLADAILADASGRALAGCVVSWSPRVIFPERLGEPARGGVMMTLALGPQEAVAAALTSAERAVGAAVQLAAFTLGEGRPWALRAQPPCASKGAALSRLAARLGVPRARVGAIGDWFNDLSMLAWAGTSFAMGQAPDEVRREATCVLRATAETGGGVAEAVALWLAEEERRGPQGRKGRKRKRREGCP
jgi:hypothetical protein